MPAVHERSRAARAASARSLPAHDLPVLAASLLVVGALAGCGPPEPPADAPAKRVILLSCDTLRADRLGLYGWQRPTSPELDRFAREALVFDDAWSAASITGPSLSSLHTGKLPDEIGVPTNRFALAPAAVTLAERAREAGYATAAVVSNYVLRRPPAALGDAGLAQGFGSYDDDMEEPEPNRPQLLERSAERTADAALAWLAARKARGEERFFFWVHWQDPHGPYTPPSELLGDFVTDPPPDEAPLPVGRGSSGKGKLPRYQAIDELRRPQTYRDRYEGEIRAFDRALGRVLRWLEESDWLDGTLLVLTADHGESLGEHDYWFCHGETLHAELVRVPLVVRFPAGVQGPRASERDGYRRVAEPVQQLDLWPTVLEALGLEPGPSRGLSLLGASLPAERELVQTLREPGTAARWSALRKGPFHLLRPAQGEAQLYDLRADPGEAQDRAAGAGSVVAELSARLDALLAAQQQVAPALPWPVGAREDAALRGLGYVGDDAAEEGGDDEDAEHGPASDTPAPGTPPRSAPR